MYRSLSAYAIFVASATFLLIIAGALVTSTGSGLAVPDWPLSYGQLFPPMVGGIFYEHGHRMIASTVGALTLILTIWVARRETLRETKVLAVFSIVAIVIQGILGGLTVIYLLPTAVSVAHAALGQLFFCIITSLVLTLSPLWRSAKRAGTEEASGKLLAGFWTFFTAILFLQLLLGALMRHTEAGLAIPDFPLAFGRVIPSFSSAPIVIHFAHRLFAVGILVLGVVLGVRSWRNNFSRQWRILAGSTVGLLFLQIGLGAGTVLSGKSVFLATAHVATGAGLLALSFCSTLLAVRTFGTPWDFQRYVQVIRNFGTLTKPRITIMVALNAAAAFYMARASEPNWKMFWSMVLGTILTGAGANALNQYMERDLDKQMNRTRMRPLPLGSMRPAHAAWFGIGISLAGFIVYGFGTNPLATGLAAFCLLTYLFVYTPLKLKTPLSTLVGAVPGAMPPLIGWAAATGTLETGAWLLFGILFLWQLPHFWAIAWLYREDYERAGFQMLPVLDRSGAITSRQLLGSSFALCAVALFPFLYGLTGTIYLCGAIILGGCFLLTGGVLASTRSRGSARRVVLASVAYLPLLLSLLVLDKR